MPDMSAMPRNNRQLDAFQILEPHMIQPRVASPGLVRPWQLLQLYQPQCRGYVGHPPVEPEHLVIVGRLVGVLTGGLALIPQETAF